MIDVYKIGMKRGVILLVIMLLAMPMVLGAAAKCGDNVCDRRENCDTCPSDCLESGQVCCNTIAYNGNCCSDNSCPSNNVCINHKCVSTVDGGISKVDEINWEMIGVIILVIGGAIGFLLTRRKRSKTARYMHEIDEVYHKYKSNSNACESELHKVEREIEDEFNKGHLTEANFSVLTRRIEKYTGDIRKGIASSSEMTPAFRRELGEALSDGRISKTEYNKLAKMKLKGLSAKEKANVRKMIKKWRQEDKANKKK
jgi:hypothetical protein